MSASPDFRRMSMNPAAGAFLRRRGTSESNSLHRVSRCYLLVPSLLLRFSARASLSPSSTRTPCHRATVHRNNSPRPAPLTLSPLTRLDRTRCNLILQTPSRMPYPRLPPAPLHAPKPAKNLLVLPPRPAVDPDLPRCHARRRAVPLGEVAG